MEHNKGKALIIGGTSGLGLSLSSALLKDNYEVTIAGRNNPNREGTNFLPIDLTSDKLSENLDGVLASIGKVNLLIYSAGFYQEGLLDEISDEGIKNMIQVGLTAPALLIQRVLKKQRALDGLIAVTSTSQTRPRLKEPVYTSIKAGIGMLANSLSLDERIGKVLVAAPAGMDTPFWKGADRGKMLNPDWVAEQIMNLYSGDFKYQHAYILRDPDRTKVEEKR